VFYRVIYVIIFFSLFHLCPPSPERGTGGRIMESSMESDSDPSLWFAPGGKGMLLHLYCMSTQYEINTKMFLFYIQVKNEMVFLLEEKKKNKKKAHVSTEKCQFKFGRL
jgi:hypothetical protein